MVERKKHLGVRMWDNIKWISILLVLGLMVYFNYQSEMKMQKQINDILKFQENTLKDMSKLNTKMDGTSRTVNWKISEMETFLDSLDIKTERELKREYNHMKTQIDIFKERIQIAVNRNNRNDDKLVADIMKEFNLQIESLEIKNEEEIKSLQLQIDELIKKLKSYKKTKKMFGN
jgi:hypothetical protein